MSAGQIQPDEPTPQPTFLKELELLIMKYGIDVKLNVPPYLLAPFVDNVLTDAHHLLSSLRRWEEG